MYDPQTIIAMNRPDAPTPTPPDVIIDRPGQWTRTPADVARIILAAGDGTFTLDGERVIENDGYEVGGYDPDMPTATPNAVRHHHTCGLFDRLAERILHLRQSPGPYRLGRWTDADGRIHFDATRFVPHPHRDHALEIGTLLDQEAIWDWAAGEAIPTD